MPSYPKRSWPKPLERWGWDGVEKDGVFVESLWVSFQN
jgi:hypothetical protein